MASQGVTATAANSRLAQMQMRFQQKQQQEREQRRIEMTTTTTATSTTTSSTASPLAEDMGDFVSGNGNGHVKAIGNGKVRQMFDERRRGVGIDRSHPLKPIASSTTAAQSSSSSSSSMMRGSKSTTVFSTRATPPAAAGAAGMRKTPAAVKRGGPTARTTPARHQTHNGNHDQLDNGNGNGNFPKQFSSMSLNEPEPIGDRNNNSKHNNNHTTLRSSNGMSRETSSNGIKLNPVVTKKSPATATRTVRQATPLVRATPPSSRNAAGVVKSPPKSAERMSVGNVSRQSQPPRPGMATCHYCGRNFNEDRLAKHEHVCQKMMNSKRKIFDAAKHRVKGTDAEKYQPRKPRGVRASVLSTPYMPAHVNTNTHAGASGGGSAAKKSNWRQKHEEFIAAIRAAKQVQAHIARGGKLSDLPPPPPSENPDYIQCPHCMRRFNEAAAERHIPKCANMLHNKPKPGQAPRRR